MFLFYLHPASITSANFTFSLSILLTKMIVGRLRLRISPQIRSVPTSTPLVPSIKTIAASTADNTFSISPMNSSEPGVSRKLNLQPFHQRHKSPY